ncbi:MAG: ROK family protein [Salinisphaeraceae bacterium]|nr:ROK family protein [Salinisphaeraceae bacterium]
MTKQQKSSGLRLGVDLGGTKIEAAVVAADGAIVSRLRKPTPQGDYQATLQHIASLVDELESELGQGALPTGVCTPGAISPATGLLKNANSTCLNGKPLKEDLQQLLQRELRLANDADCLAVSEATDGAGSGAQSVFAVILGTGVGGGLVYEGKLLSGPHAITGEWGHNPLPWLKADWQELSGPACWCGLHGCIETWLSGPGLAQDYGDPNMPGQEILHRAESGEAAAKAALSRYEDRLARALAHVINLFDPEVIVLGGGLSNIQHLYDTVPAMWDAWVFSDEVNSRLLPARHGDASGVRGAAWLW